jgi:DNA-binding response OmpR family regulator
MVYLCLVVQQDATAARATNGALEKFGLKPYNVQTLTSALSILGQWRFDIVLIDADGFGDRVLHLLSDLAKSRLPIVVSSSAKDEDAQIHLLELGATECVSKPSSIRLVALRLRRLAEIQRQKPPDVAPEVRLGPLLLDTHRVRASVSGVPLELTTRQFDFLLLLALRAGEFVHRQTIATTIRLRSDEGSRSIDMLVSRIRRKLREAGDARLSIHTIYGRGYSLAFASDPSIADDGYVQWCA